MEVSLWIYYCQHKKDFEDSLKEDFEGSKRSFLHGCNNNFLKTLEGCYNYVFGVVKTSYLDQVWHGNQGRFQLCLISEFWYFTVCKIGPLSLVWDPIGSWFKNIGFEH
jgi:hypothetical protein